MKRTPSRNPPSNDPDGATPSRHSMPPIAFVTTTAAVSPTQAVDPTDSVWLSMAHLIPEGEVVPCRVDVQLVCHNLVEGAERLTQQRAALESAGVAVDSARLAATPSLALALASVSVLSPRAATGSREKLTEFTPLANAIFDDAARQAAKGRLPAKVVTSLRAAEGVVARVRAVAQLVGMYGKARDVIDGRTNLDDGELRRAGALCAELLSLLRMEDSQRGADDEVRRAAIDLRARYWTLVKRHHAWMQRVAGAMWGDAAREYVPPLGSRRVVRRAKPAAAKPTPA